MQEIKVLSNKNKKTLFTGIQPSGDLHLGNYLGAICPWIEHQKQYNSIFCIVDLHTLTQYKHILNKDRKEYVYKMISLCIACGIDPKYSSIFIQSHLPLHVELSWILNCMTPLGWLKRMTQYKSKKDDHTINSGLLNYPILMAADILLHKANVVLVGYDQHQHIELTCKIGRRFNNLFGKTFIIPTVLTKDIGARIMSFNNPHIKMSKSVGISNPGHSINVLDDEKTIIKTVMSSVTDSDNNFKSEGIQNLFNIACAISQESFENLFDRFSIKNYLYLKKYIIELLIEEFRPIQQHFYKISKEYDYLDSIISDGLNYVSKTSYNMINNVREHIGIKYS